MKQVRKRKTTLGQGSQFPGRDLSSKSPKYKVGTPSAEMSHDYVGLFRNINSYLVHIVNLLSWIWHFVLQQMSRFHRCLEWLFYAIETVREQSEFLGNTHCFPGNDILSCYLFNVVQKRGEVSTERTFKLNFLIDWWYFAVNTTTKISHSNWSHCFYLMVATCFGPHMRPSLNTSPVVKLI
jgi:hypothetical protein